MFLGFVDDSGREVKAVIEAIVWEMLKMDFILGLPDVLRFFLDMFIGMLREAECCLFKFDHASELSQVDDVVADAVPWSDGQNTESPEELETPEPSHFAPYLTFMEVPYEDARVEYMEIFDARIGDMLKGSREFKNILTSELALGRFVPEDWTGIVGFPPLDLVVREDFPVSHKVRARPINPRLFKCTKIGFERLMCYMYRLSVSP